jgi:hypothetical protein
MYISIAIDNRRPKRTGNVDRRVDVADGTSVIQPDTLYTIETNCKPQALNSLGVFHCRKACQGYCAVYSCTSSPWL